MGGTTAFTDGTSDRDFMMDHLTVNKIDQVTFVVAVNAEIS